MRIETERQKVRRLRVDAQFDGRLQDGIVNLAGDCMSPANIFLSGQPDPVVDTGRRAAVAEAQVRCRHCETCQSHRRQLWYARAQDEVRLSNRTWFGTLTCGEGAHTERSARARKRAKRRTGEDFELLDPRLQFAYVTREYREDIQRYLKRLRKDSQAKLRYLILVEAHKSGFPHWHLLLHECTEVPIRKSTLESQWSLGFSHWRLVDKANPTAVGYVVKYLTKSSEARIVASLRYGAPRIGADVDAR